MSRPAPMTWRSRAWYSSTINLRSLLIAAILAAAVLLRFPVDDLRLEMEFLVRLAAIAGLALYLWTINPWWAAFLALAGVSHVYPAHTRSSYLAFDAVLHGAVWFAVLTSVLRRRDLTVLYNTLAAICCFNLFWQVLQAFELDPVFAALADGPMPRVGFMLNQNFCGAFAAFCLPVFLRPGWRWGLAVVGLSLFLAQTSLAVFSAFAGLLFFGVVKKKIVLSLALAVCGSAGYILLVDGPGFERWPVWKLGLLGWIEEPWFGFGLGHWALLFQKPVSGAGTGIWMQAHNEFLQGLFEMGIGFGIVVVGYLAGAWNALRRRAGEGLLIPATALVIIAVNSAANFPFHVGATAIVAVTWMACFEIERVKP